jgi:N-acetylneuraminic acid mutarotase
MTDLRDAVEAPEEERTAGRRLIAALVAFAVFAGAGVWAWFVLSGRITEPAPHRSVAATDPLDAIPKGWTKLPEPPVVHSGSAAVWAGTEVIEWGGSTYDRETDTTTYSAGGYGFDPVEGKWHRIPDAPSGRAGAIAVWTGSEAIFLSGWNDERTFANGFAYDPAASTWRTIAASPLDGSPATVTWTGSEVIAWGSGGRESAGDSGRGAAYDPVTDTWKRIADAPHGLNLASAVWTGDELIVFGSLLDNRNIADTDTSIGAAYDPSTDKWHELPPSDLSPQSTAAVWLGEELVAWDYGNASERYVPGDDHWKPLPKVPFSSGECYVDGVAVGDVAFAWDCADPAVFDPKTKDWSPVRGGPADQTIEANGSSYKLFRFADLIPAGPVVFLELEGITVTQGAPCYGCSGSPTAFWVYRPA